MTGKSSFSKRTWFEKFERGVSISANIVVISGILFAFYQIELSKQFEKRRTSIEAVSPTRSNDFLKAYANLKGASSKFGEIEDQKSLYDDLNYVMNVYDNIAVLYINNLTNKCIIKSAVYSTAKEFSHILDTMPDYPKEYRESFDALLMLMEQESCGR